MTNVEVFASNIDSLTPGFNLKHESFETDSEGLRYGEKLSTESTISDVMTQMNNQHNKSVVDPTVDTNNQQSKENNCQTADLMKQSVNEADKQQRVDYGLLSMKHLKDNTENLEKNLSETSVASSTKENSALSDSASTDSALDDFMATLNSSLEDLEAKKKQKKKIVCLPGFLFVDGKAQFIEPVDSSEVQESTVKVKYGTSDEECERLTMKYFNNSFEVFNISIHSTDADIRKAFKKVKTSFHQITQ